MGARADQPTQLVVSFVMYDDNRATILVEHPCPTHGLIHTNRLPLDRLDGALCMGAVAALLGRIGFTQRCENVDEQMSFALDVLDDIGGIE
jgi:hypothetical protein